MEVINQSIKSQIFLMYFGQFGTEGLLKEIKTGSVYITTSYQEVNSLAYYEALASGCIIFARIAGDWLILAYREFISILIVTS